MAGGHNMLNMFLLIFFYHRLHMKYPTFELHSNLGSKISFYHQQQCVLYTTSTIIMIKSQLIIIQHLPQEWPTCAVRHLRPFHIKNRLL